MPGLNSNQMPLSVVWMKCRVFSKQELILSTIVLVTENESSVKVNYTQAMLERKSNPCILNFKRLSNTNVRGLAMILFYQVVLVVYPVTVV